MFQDWECFELLFCCQPIFTSCHCMRFRRIMVEIRHQSTERIFSFNMYFERYCLPKCWFSFAVNTILLQASANSIMGREFCFVLFLLFQFKDPCRHQCQASRKYLHRVIPIALCNSVPYGKSEYHGYIGASRERHSPSCPEVLLLPVALKLVMLGHSNQQQHSQLLWMPSGPICRHPSAWELSWGTRHRDEVRSFNITVLH